MTQEVQLNHTLELQKVKMLKTNEGTGQKVKRDGACEPYEGADLTCKSKKLFFPKENVKSK